MYTVGNVCRYDLAKMRTWSILKLMKILFRNIFVKGNVYNFVKIIFSQDGNLQ